MIIYQQKGVNTMGASNKIKQAMVSKGVQSGEMAAVISKSPGVFYNYLLRDTMKYEDVEKMANYLGYDLVLMDRESGQII